MASEEILAEYREVLRRPRFGLSADLLARWDDRFSSAIAIWPVTVPVHFPRDQKDAKFLACALAAEADYLLTGDGISRSGLHRKGADDFWRALRGGVLPVVRGHPAHEPPSTPASVPPRSPPSRCSWSPRRPSGSGERASASNAAGGRAIKTCKSLTHAGEAVCPLKGNTRKTIFLLVGIIQLLNRSMNDIEKRISEHPFFRSMAPAHLGLVTKSATEAKFETNQIIFHEKAPADRFFLIESGRVALGWHTPEGKMILVQTLGPGEVIGWSWLFPPFVWHFQARATEPTCTVVLNGGDLLVAAEDNPQFGYDLMRRIAQMVITRLQASRRSRVVADEAK